MRPVAYFSFLLLFQFSLIFSQDLASVQWTCTQPDSQGVSAIAGAVDAFDVIGGRNFNVYQYHSLQGPLGNSQRWCPIVDGTRTPWGLQTEPVDTQYVQFAVKSGSNFTLQTDSVSMYLGAAGTTDHIKVQVFSSIGNDFTSSTEISDSAFYPPRDSYSKYSFTLNEQLTDEDTLFIRIYVWYDATSMSTSKYFLIQDVNFYGNTEAVVTPASATWELTDPGTGGTGQTVSTSGPVSGTDETFSNMRINQYTGAENSQRSDNRPPGGATEWPANQTERIDSVYVQFAVSPIGGTNLTVKNISFEIGGASINYMKADVLYSTDSTFISYDKVPDSLVLEGDDYAYPGHLLRGDTLNPVSFNLTSFVESGEIFYLRFYPWVHDQPEATGKYLLLKNVVISGNVEGTAIYDLPTITTSSVTYISTTYATSGGNISSDGGALVTARGVVWDTTSSPTIENSLTLDGEGSGSFVSSVTGLTPGMAYYLRAYATNIAGTAYGEEIMFTTYDSIVVPIVTTAAVENILVKSAESGGAVTDWGGSDVIVRGIVWNSVGNPTLADSTTENGAGLGSFTSILYPLEATTTYFVRAYATNSAGTGYGTIFEFTTQAPAPDVTKVVDKSGNGDYTTVQAAFDDVPDFYTGTWTIMVNSGVYYEKLLLDRNKTNVVFKAVHPDSVVLTYDDYANISGGTSTSYSVAIDADDFTAINITFQNTHQNDGGSGQQAVALRTNGDRQQYINCKLLGYQDTYYAWGGRGTGRTYMKNCYIEGSVDFIFGRNIVLLDSCQIHVIRNKCSITAANTNAESKFGFVFKNCTISHESVDFDGNNVTEIYLGRAWQAEPRTVFMNSYEPAAITPQAWNPVPINSGVVPALYAVYENFGPGYNSTEHANGIGRLLTPEEASEYTVENIFSKESNPLYAYDWIPEEILITSIEHNRFKETIPTKFSLEQNFPNPFNPSTTITYSVPKNAHIKIKLYNVLGKEVLTLVNGKKDAGLYKLVINAQNLSSGIYFYTMQTENFLKTKKMLLLK